MSSPSKLFAAFFVAILSAASSAQIVPIGAFTGAQSESFETQTSGQFTTCISGRVFGNSADLCDPQGNSMHITTGWSYMCQIGPNSGNKLSASAGGPAEWTFDTPATKFGGMFGTNCGIADATFEFYDVNNALISSQLALIPADCSWNWLGWQVTGGPSIRRVKIIGHLSGGSYVMMDDMQVDYTPACTPPVTYCTPKTNSIGCIPAIQWTGSPSATAINGCTIKCTNVRNNKPGILIYGVTGQAATPFAGGFLCLQPPIRRTPPTNSGGTPLPASDCSGVYSIDMNMLSHGLLGGVPLGGLVVPGTVVNCQYWGVDPGYPAPNNTTLSEGLQYTVCP